MSHPSIRDQFLANFLRQHFSLPDSIIYHILKNPTSSKVYQKLTQTCKYFFIKNPILVIHCLEIRDDGWTHCSNQNDCDETDFHQTIDSRIFSSWKLWIDVQIRINTTDPNVALNLIPKIYQCDAIRIDFVNQKMPIQKFLFYAENSEICYCENVILSSDGCDEIPLEGIVASLPMVSHMHFDYGPSSKNVSSDTVKNLFQIPHFKNIEILRVLNVTEKFDIDPIFDHYMKNRPNFTFGVNYRVTLSEAMATKIDGFVREILDHNFDQFQIPFIVYPEQSAFHTYYLMQKFENYFSSIF